VSGADASTLQPNDIHNFPPGLQIESGFNLIAIVRDSWACLALITYACRF
jgi:hypothetical protein